MTSPWRNPLLQQANQRADGRSHPAPQSRAPAAKPETLVSVSAMDLRHRRKPRKFRPMPSQELRRHPRPEGSCWPSGFWRSMPETARAQSAPRRDPRAGVSTPEADQRRCTRPRSAAQTPRPNGAVNSLPPGKFPCCWRITQSLRIWSIPAFPGHELLEGGNGGLPQSPWRGFLRVFSAGPGRLPPRARCNINALMKRGRFTGAFPDRPFPGACHGGGALRRSPRRLKRGRWSGLAPGDHRLWRWPLIRRRMPETRWYAGQRVSATAVAIGDVVPCPAPGERLPLRWHGAQRPRSAVNQAPNHRRKAWPG